MVNEYNSREIVKIFPNRLSDDTKIRIHENITLGKGEISNIKRSNLESLAIHWGIQAYIGSRSN